MPILLPIHVTAGLIAIASGFVALYSLKGGNVHRKGGMIFAVAMMTMTTSAVIMAAYLRPHIGNVIAGLVTFYLVGTGLLTVVRTVAQSRALLSGLMLAAALLGAFAITLAYQAAHSPIGTLDGIPPQPIYVFGTVAILGAALDARVLFVGAVLGKHRLARHLWRMTLGLLIATLSFFLGQPQVFPEPLRHAMGLRSIPVLLVLFTLIYWLVRVYVKRQPLGTRPAPRAATSASSFTPT
jgi:hypothetical protein